MDTAQSPQTKSWDQAFTDDQWKTFRDHGEEIGFAKCKCTLCKKIRKAIQVEVRRPLKKPPKEDKARDEARYKEWQDIPIQAFIDHDKHEETCTCENCMIIKNFFGKTKK